MQMLSDAVDAARAQRLSRVERIREVERRLAAEYGSPRHHNRRNPLDELLFIILSTLTQEANYVRTFRSLKRAFPTFSALAAADPESIAVAIADGGLSTRKSRAIHAIMLGILNRYGVPSLSSLSRLEDHECEEELLALPLVGLKTARCVMMYSLDREVFPVDTHCWRIARRLDWVRPTRPDGSCSDRDMNRLQAAIPANLRHSLHVTMLAHGRAVCRPKPRCGQCVIANLCRRG